ncbi:FHA domain-containing protein [Streptomyces sp. MUM 16J]|uniref:FHA domain-containing protein n=1 Tax=Streptomyces sp. MUM 16J TaxID=2791988 RepID=UPI001F047B70|nr:FHA domain-containing protein [Streptomyces sp. MUM 16J]MCH0560537.1 FHA domain-containing protein [Streptomyces sp. MUM 16J]
MQIRLTVVDPVGPSAQRGRAASRDVLVTAPAGTDLAAVASGLAGALTGEGGTARDTGGAPVVLYSGTDRLDLRRRILGEPPLVDGALLSLGAPAAPEPHPEMDDAPTRLHAVAGPDAGGVHLLHGGRITVGRSTDADVPLDDPDVSRLHCAVTVGADGRVSVTDLGSTNGTTLNGVRVADRPVRFPAGAVLRIGESALRVTPSGGPGARLRTVPDGEGRVRVALGDAASAETFPEASGGDGTPDDARFRRGTPVPGGAGAPPTSAGGVDGTRTASPGPGAAGRSARPAGTAPGAAGTAPGAAGADPGAGAAGYARGNPAPGAEGVPGAVHHAYDSVGRSTSTGGTSAREHRRGERSAVPGQAGAPGIEHRGTGPGPAASGAASGGDTHAGRSGIGGLDGAHPGEDARGHGRKGTSGDGDGAPHGARRRGLGSWARRLAGGRGEQPGGREAYDAAAPRPGGAPTAGAPQRPEVWPDPATLLLTALGPGPRLWERGPGHPEMLTIRLGTADRSAPDGSGLLPAVPVTAALREGGALGLAGPRPRLSGLARAVLAQLAALHSPDLLEIVLISADRSRPVQERTAEWSWLGWLPHVRPGRGQDCRLLLAYDREQAAARAQELLRRVEDHATAGRSTAHPARLPAPAAPGRTPATDAAAPSAHDSPTRTPDAPGRGPRTTTPTPPALGSSPGTPGIPAQTQASGTAGRPAQHAPSGAPGHSSPPGKPAHAPAPGVPGTPAPGAVAESLADRSGSDAHRPGMPGTARPPAPSTTTTANAAPTRRPSWARHDADPGVGGGFEGPYTVVVVDGDPGGAALQETLARLAVAGPRAGIHVVCLAETEPASPASSVMRTYEAACAVTPTFRHCGAVALLSGDVATALHLLRVAPGGPLGPGTLAAVDAVSAAWAERFARALAPLRPDGDPVGGRRPRAVTPLPRSARLLDELGLARATPASLMARWADAADDPESLGGRARAVLGVGPHGPLTADLVADGPHLLIEGPAGSGRTELLRAVVASLAAAERPDHLSMVLVDGRDGVGTDAGQGEGLRVCTDVPHVTTHLVASDPVRMREFAQSLSAELKRRAELLGRTDFAEWHAGRQLPGRIGAQRTPATGDIDTPPSSTLRLRPRGARHSAAAVPPLPRLVVVVDDLDMLVSPPLGSPGRPAAGSVMRALESVAREGERLGVHLVAATGPGGPTAETEPARRAGLRIVLDSPKPTTGGTSRFEGSSESGGKPAPGRGWLTYPDGQSAPFQGGRVTGRIPRTATQRPTVVPVDWQRMGDPPARRPVRELGNGPTDLALLASAVERAARQVSAAEVPSLL